MPEFISEAAGVAKEVVAKAGNPLFVLGLSFIMLFGSLLFGIGYTLNSFARPLLDAQLKSVAAANEAIVSNSETNKNMGLTINTMKTMIETHAENQEKALANQKTIMLNNEQLLRDHQRIMKSIDNSSSQRIEAGGT